MTKFQLHHQRRICESYGRALTLSIDLYVVQNASNRSLRLGILNSNLETDTRSAQRRQLQRPEEPTTDHRCPIQPDLHHPQEASATQRYDSKSQPRSYKRLARVSPPACTSFQSAHTHWALHIRMVCRTSCALGSPKHWHLHLCNRSHRMLQLRSSIRCRHVHDIRC
jgi:hypothetical protein